MTAPPSVKVDPTTGQVSEIGDFKVDMSMLESSALDEFRPAYKAAKAEFTKIRKDKANDFLNSSYADLSSVLDATEPSLDRNGLVLLGQTFIDGEGRNVLWTRLVHVESGQWVGSLWTLRPVKQDPQAEGSVLTYARRYQDQLILGVTAVDDDGAAASTPPERARRLDADKPRDWFKDAQLIAGDKTKPAPERRVALLNLIEICEKAQQMTPAIKRKMIALGKGLAAEIEAAKPPAAVGQ